MPIFLGSQLVEPFGGTKNITGGVSLQEKTVELSETYQTVVADGQYDGLSKVNIPGISSNYIGSGVKKKTAQQYTPNNATQTIVSGQYLTGNQVINPVPTETKSITTNGTYIPSSGKYFSSVEVNVEGQISNLQDQKTVTPTASTINVLPDSGYGGLAKVVVNPVPTETKTASKNGDVTPTAGKFLSKVTVNVQPTLETVTITPTATTQEKTPSAGKDGFSKVTVKPVPTQTKRTYINGTITPDAGYFLSSVEVEVPQSPQELAIVSNPVNSTTPAGTNAVFNVGATGIGLSYKWQFQRPGETTWNDSTAAGSDQATITIESIASRNGQKYRCIVTDGMGMSATSDYATMTVYNTQAAKTITPTTSEQTAVASGVLTTGVVKVAAVPTETINVTENGEVTPTSGKFFSKVTVDVQPTLETLTITPSETLQEKTPADGVYGFSKVTVNAITNTYVGSGITKRSSTDLTVNGPTVTIPSGYYSSQATKSVASGAITVSTPTISSTGLITSSATVTAGYISSAPNSKTLQLTTQGAKTITPSESQQTAVAKGVYTTGDIIVSAIQTEEGSALDNGTYYPTDGKFFSQFVVDVEKPNLQGKTATPSESKQTITPDTAYNGLSSVTVNAITNTYVGSAISKRSSTDVTASGKTVTVPAGYYSSQVTKAVGDGAVTIGTPTISASGLITASATVTAGYVSSNPTSKTLQLTTQATKTITPSSSQQTAVAKGVYTTGNVVVSAVPTETTTINQNGTFTPSTGKYFNSVTVEIPIQHYYTGNAAPSSSLGVDGDIYLKV